MTCVLEELRSRYWGCIAGAKQWRYKPSIPSIIMGLVTSLANKINELVSLFSNQKCRTGEQCYVLYMANWRNFTIVKADRKAKACGKPNEGGLALFFNIRWCNPGQLIVKDIFWSWDVESLSIQLSQEILVHHFCLCLHSFKSRPRHSMCSHSLNYREPSHTTPWCLCSII